MVLFHEKFASTDKKINMSDKYFNDTYHESKREDVTPLSYENRNEIPEKVYDRHYYMYNEEATHLIVAGIILQIMFSIPFSNQIWGTIKFLPSLLNVGIQLSMLFLIGASSMMYLVSIYILPSLQHIGVLETGDNTEWICFGVLYAYFPFLFASLYSMRSDRTQHDIAMGLVTASWFWKFTFFFFNASFFADIFLHADGSNFWMPVSWEMILIIVSSALIVFRPHQNVHGFEKQSFAQLITDFSLGFAAFGLHLLAAKMLLRVVVHEYNPKYMFF